MKRSITLLLVMLMVLASATVAYSLIDLTLKSTYDIDTEVTSAYSEVKVGIKPEPFDISLKWTHNFLPTVSNPVELTTKFVLGKFTLKYVRKLHIVDTGKLTATLKVTPLTFEWSRSMDPGVSGKISLKYVKSF